MTSNLVEIVEKSEEKVERLRENTENSNQMRERSDSSYKALLVGGAVASGTLGLAGAITAYSYSEEHPILMSTAGWIAGNLSTLIAIPVVQAYRQVRDSIYRN